MHDKPISGALSKIVILVLEHKLSVRGQEGLAVFNFVLCLNKIQLLTIGPVTWFIRFNQVVRIYAETSHFYEKSITYKPAFIFLTLWYFGFLLVKWVSVSCGVSPPPMRNSLLAVPLHWSSRPAWSTLSSHPVQTARDPCWVWTISTCISQS